MAKHTGIAGGCGHEHTIHVDGPYAERERKIEWFEREGLCGDCYKAQRAEQDAREREAERNRPVAKSEVVAVMRERNLDAAAVLEMVGMTQAEATDSQQEFLDRAGVALGLR